MLPAAGSPAPNFELLDADSKPVSLKDFQGKWAVLYFYPKDLTPGCTIEAVDFTCFETDFRKANAVVLGVSKDSCESHQKFRAKKTLTIRLLSDPDTKMQKSYGVWGEKQFLGKKYMGTFRTTFLIDPKGKIAHIWEKSSRSGMQKMF